MQQPRLLTVPGRGFARQRCGTAPPGVICIGSACALDGEEDAPGTKLAGREEVSADVQCVCVWPWWWRGGRGRVSAELLYFLPRKARGHVASAATRRLSTGSKQAGAAAARRTRLHSHGSQPRSAKK
eukprot:scaffold3459_cov119-Isochrysis_galbana.AAC.3